MENDDNRTSFRARYLNQKTILILLSLVVVVVAGTGFGLVKASNNPAFCTNCHIMNPYYESWNDSGLLANKHAAAGVTCHDCHESSISIQASEGWKFVTGDYKTPLDKREFGTKDYCLNCHSASGTGTPKGTIFEDAKTKTIFTESNPHDSHNGEQNCNLCHSMHQQSTVMCLECHQVGWIDELDGSWNKK